MIGRLGLAACAAAVAALTGCDLGPSGPGTLAGTVSAPEPLGAVILEIVGASVQGFEGQGGTLAYDVTLPDQKDLPPYVRKYRVMLVGRTPGALGFGVRVSDLDHDFPAVSAVLAADAADEPRLAGDVQARLFRPGS